MILSLESGRNIRNVTEADILANIVYGETFAILLCNDDTYMQCATAAGRHLTITCSSTRKARWSSTMRLWTDRLPSNGCDPPS